MKKLFFLFLCALFLFSSLVGCQTQENPEEKSLPYETYGGYRILNITPTSTSLTAGGSKPSSFDIAMKTVSSSEPVGGLVKEWSLGEDVYVLSFSKSVYVPRGDFRKNVYSIASSNVADERARVEFTEEGELEALFRLPIELPDLTVMSNEEIRLMFEAIFAKHIDFSIYTNVSFSRTPSTDDTVQIIWSRTHGEYMLDDAVRISTIFGEFSSLYTNPRIDVPETLVVPSFEELRPVIDEYLKDYFEGTGKILISFDLQSGELIKFDGSFALTLDVGVDWNREEGGPCYGELVCVLVLLK